jgi:hypothetical protein
MHYLGATGGHKNHNQNLELISYMLHQCPETQQRGATIIQN